VRGKERKVRQGGRVRDSKEEGAKSVQEGGYAHSIE